MRAILPYILLSLFSGFALASSPLGLWTTIDEKSGKKRAVVKFYNANNKLMGKIIKIYKEPGDTDVCSKCPGRFKNKPTVGLNFIWGLTPTGKDSWAGGSILDFEKGKIYRFKMQLKGDKLYVRGYLGTPLLGRSQVWIRN